MERVTAERDVEGVALEIAGAVVDEYDRTGRELAKHWRCKCGEPGFIARPGTDALTPLILPILREFVEQAPAEQPARRQPKPGELDKLMDEMYAEANAADQPARALGDDAGPCSDWSRPEPPPERHDPSDAHWQQPLSERVGAEFERLNTRLKKQDALLEECEQVLQDYTYHRTDARILPLLAKLAAHRPASDREGECCQRNVFSNEHTPGCTGKLRKATRPPE